MWAGNYIPDATLAGIVNSPEGGTAMFAGPAGDFHSRMLNATPDDEIAVMSSAIPYLVPSDDLASVNSKNVGDYSMGPVEGDFNAHVYSYLNGSYYVIMFQNSSSVEYAVLDPGMSDLFGVEPALLGLGIFVSIAGAVISTAGVILKPRK